MQKKKFSDIDTFLTNHLESKRALAVKMDLQGYSHELIANLLHVSQAFIRKWKRLYRQKGSTCFSLQYKGKQPFLSPKEHQEVIAFLQTKEYYSVEELRDYLELYYNVVYKSKQSYYDLLHAAHISWKKKYGNEPEA